MKARKLNCSPEKTINSQGQDALEIQGLARPSAYTPSHKALLSKFKCTVNTSLFLMSTHHYLPFNASYESTDFFKETVITNLQVFIGACSVPRLPWMQARKQKQSMYEKEIEEPAFNAIQKVGNE